MEELKSKPFKNSYGYLFQWVGEKLYVKSTELDTYSIPVSATIEDLKLYIKMYENRS